jgi:glucokinase
METRHLPAEVMLVGDVGGTKTILAIWSSAQPLQPLAVETFRNRSFERFEEVVASFLCRERGAPVTSAVFAVAGLVVGNTARLANLPWRLDANELRARFSLTSVLLMNDLEALAWAVPDLSPSDRLTLRAGVAQPGGAQAVIAPGTGLGEAFLTWTGREYVAHPTEGGHADFAPTDEEQMKLLAFLRCEHPHVSVERVCSGLGVQNIYRFLRDARGVSEPAEVSSEIAAATDPTPTILAAALDHRSERCARSLEIFVRILGSEIGNLALKVLSTGGVFLGGGIPPRIRPLLESEIFTSSYLNKGRHAALLERIPVYLVTDPAAALSGAALRGWRALGGSARSADEEGGSR